MKKISIVLISVILCVLFTGYFNFRQDDAYIFYTYAKNIADGNGYVFNIGEKVNATTSPLYTLLLAFIYLLIKPVFPDSLVFAGSFISTASLILILYSIKKIICDEDKFLLFALIMFSMPMLKFGFGMETFLNLALIVYSVYLFTKNKFNLASVFAGLSVLARMDSILFVAVIFFCYLYKHRNLPPISSFIIFILIIAPWFIFSKFYFDSFLPTTIAVKLSQQEFDMHGTGLIFLKGFIYAIPGTYLSFTVLAFGFLISMIVLSRKKINVIHNEGLKIVFLWSSALFITYAFVLNAPPYQWYYTPFSIPLTILFTFVLSHLLNRILLRRIVIVFLFCFSCVLPVKNIVEGYNPKYIYYTEAAEWLNKNTPEAALVGVDEIGILGYYYKNGKLVDALGLITPEVASHLAKRDFGWYLKQYSPDYIVNDYPFVQKHAGGKEDIFQQNYEVIKVFESRKEKIAVYKKRHH